jgi:hypothetical protein
MVWLLKCVWSSLYKITKSRACLIDWMANQLDNVQDVNPEQASLTTRPHTVCSARRHDRSSTARKLGRKRRRP